MLKQEGASTIFILFYIPLKHTLVYQLMIGKMTDGIEINLSNKNPFLMII